MSERTLTQKLGIKAGHKCLILNAPAGYLKVLGELPPNTTIATEPDGSDFDLVQVFVHNKTEVDSLALIAIDALKHDGLLWMTYPKKSSKIKTDITRDIGWETVNAKGLEIVAAISTNHFEEQETALLALHLPPSNLVYINTLMLQQWYARMAVEDWPGLAPLCLRHLNPFGRFGLKPSRVTPTEGSFKFR